MRGGGSCRGAWRVNEFSKQRAGTHSGHGMRVLCFAAHLRGEENVGLFKEELAGFPLNKPSKMENHLWDERNI